MNEQPRRYTLAIDDRAIDDLRQPPRANALARPAPGLLLGDTLWS
jgi:hypothetical protein